MLFFCLIFDRRHLVATLSNIGTKIDFRYSNEEKAEPEDSDLELMAQNDKLMELILDISNELDINVLCHKILVNVCRLTKADRSSLFLARGPRGKRYLEAKLFDVKVDTGNLT